MNKHISLLLFLFISTLNICFSQEFSKKELKRMKPILKRSTSNFKDFNKEALISVEKTNNEEIDGLVENALFSGGFQVVSNKVAKESLNITNPLNPNNENIEVSKSITFKSVYVITISCNIFNESVIGRSCGAYIKSFTARVVDLANEGKLVGTYKFSGHLECLEDVANTFVYSLTQSNAK